MRRVIVGLALLNLLFAGCSSDPLKYRVSEDVVGALPANQLKEAKEIQTHVEAAKQAWEIAKQKQKLVELEFEAAKRFARAAELRVKAIREKLALQNKGVPMKLPAGILDQATGQQELAKKNLKYRRLLAELHEKRVAYLFMKYQSARAHYFETVAGVAFKAGHEATKKMRRSDYVRQAAERKTMVAESLEEVEKGEAAIKTLKAEVEPEWAPNLSCKPTPAPQPAASQPQPAGGTPQPNQPPKPDEDK